MTRYTFSSKEEAASFADIQRLNGKNTETFYNGTTWVVTVWQ